MVGGGCGVAAHRRRRAPRACRQRGFSRRPGAFAARLLCGAGRRPARARQLPDGRQLLARRPGGGPHLLCALQFDAEPRLQRGCSHLRKHDQCRIDSFWAAGGQETPVDLHTWRPSRLDQSGDWQQRHVHHFLEHHRSCCGLCRRCENICDVNKQDSWSSFKTPSSSPGSRNPSANQSWC